MKKKFEGYLLVSDMDGTLIDNKGNISEENINAINRFVKQGGIFTIATGRMLESAKKYLHLIDINIPVILYNGSKIHDYNRKETIYELFLGNEIKSLIKKVKKADTSLGIEIYCEENVYIFSHCRFTKRFAITRSDVHYDIPEDLWNKNWIKILILGEQDQIDRLEDIFISTFGQSNLVRSGENYLELLPQCTSKGHALERLCKMLNIDISKAISVGDNMNDYEMLRRSGYGFCVANGNKKLLNEVKYKCCSNDEHAIEYVVNWAEKNLAT